MSGPGRADFNSRLVRLEQARSHGLGFEAEGTLGRSFYTQARDDVQKRRWVGLRLLILAVVMGLALKTLVLHQQDLVAYQARVVFLIKNQELDRIGGWLVQTISCMVEENQKAACGLRGGLASFD